MTLAAIVAALVVAYALWLAARAWRQRLEGEAEKAIQRGEYIVGDAPVEALALARRAVDAGVKGLPLLRAWLVAARAYEYLGELDAADDALAAAKKLEVKVGDRGLWLQSKLQRSFVKAAMGDVDAAHDATRGIEPREVRLPVASIYWVKARAMIGYRSGDFARAVDLASEPIAVGAQMPARDRALLEALQQSSLLRVGGANPMRVASPPSLSAAAGADAVDDDDEEWARAVLERKSAV